MAGSMNKAMLIGNVGKDPEIRSLSSGDKVANFSLATSKSWKDKNGEKREITQWHNIVVWNEGLVTIVDRYVRKGSKIAVVGEIETRKWEKDGQDRYTTEIVLNRFGSELHLLGDKPSGDSGRDSRRDESRSERPAEKRAYDRDLDDDIPF